MKDVFDAFGLPGNGLCHSHPGTPSPATPVQVMKDVFDAHYKQKYMEKGLVPDGNLQHLIRYLSSPMSGPYLWPLPNLFL